MDDSDDDTAGFQIIKPRIRRALLAWAPVPQGSEKFLPLSLPYPCLDLLVWTAGDVMLGVLGVLDVFGVLDVVGVSGVGDQAPKRALPTDRSKGLGFSRIRAESTVCAHAACLFSSDSVWNQELFTCRVVQRGHFGYSLSWNFLARVPPERRTPLRFHSWVIPCPDVVPSRSSLVIGDCRMKIFIMRFDMSL